MSDNGSNMLINSSVDAVPLTVKSTLTGNIATIGFQGASSANTYNVRLGVNVEDMVFYTSNTERMRITSTGVIRGLYSADPGAGAIIAKFLSFSSSPYGLIFRGYSTGVNSIQNQREGNDAQLYDLSLQPLGGNVGINTITPTGKLDVTSTTSGSTVFVVNGVSGQLFSVTDSLTGDLFAVSDISGIPILTVNSGNIVKVDGSLYMNSSTYTGITATSVIQTIAYSSSTTTAVFFDYYVVNTASGYYRAGTIMSVCNGSSATYTDNSTPDLIGSTTGITLSVDYTSPNIRLVATITSGTWTIKLGTRVL